MDSAEYILDKISDSNLSDRQLADYWRIRTKTHILKGQATAEDSMIIYSLQYYKKNNMQEELKESYKLAINHFSWKNDSANRNYYLDEALQYASQDQDSLFASIIYRTAANDYYNVGNFDSACQYYVKSAKYNPTYSSHFYMTALSYSRQDNTTSSDTASSWMNKAIALAKNQDDTLKLLHYYRNYADIQIRFKEYDKAIENIKNMEKYQEKGTFSVVPYMIATIFFQKHELDSAQFYLNKMKEQNFVGDDNKSFAFTKKGVDMFQSIIDYTKGGTLDLGVIGQYTDSLQFDQDKKRIKSEEQVAAKEKLKEQNLELIIKKQHTQLVLLAVLFVLVVGGGFVYLYIKKKKEKLFQMEEKMDSLQELLADVSDDLRSGRENSAFVKKTLLRHLGIIRLTASNPTERNKEMLHRMAEITNDKIPVDSLVIWNELYTLIDSLYDNFYTKMKNKYEEVLSEKELQLCCLLCADFTTKEISAISRQGFRTIYQRKSTLRDKLKMNQAEDIVNFIRQNS